MAVKCKISSWGCIYHACMSDDCQKAIMHEQGYDYGPGNCEEIKPIGACKTPAIIKPIGICKKKAEIKLLNNIAMNKKSINRSYVSRSVYQKVAEENKRLKKDLRIICMNLGIEAIMLRMRWRDKFMKQDKFWEDIKKILRKEISKTHKSGLKSKNID